MRNSLTASPWPPTSHRSRRSLGGVLAHSPGFRLHVGHPQPTVLGSSPVAPGTWENPSPSLGTEGLDRAPGSWLQPGAALGAAGVWGVNGSEPEFSLRSLSTFHIAKTDKTAGNPQPKTRSPGSLGHIRAPTKHSDTHPDSRQPRSPRETAWLPTPTSCQLCAQPRLTRN